MNHLHACQNELVQFIQLFSKLRWKVFQNGYIWSVWRVQYQPSNHRWTVSRNKSQRWPNSNEKDNILKFFIFFSYLAISHSLTNSLTDVANKNWRDLENKGFAFIFPVCFTVFWNVWSKSWELKKIPIQMRVCIRGETETSTYYFGLGRDLSFAKGVSIDLLVLFHIF